MDDHDVLAERFEAHRARLRAVAYRTLGSASEADDAVQEAWLRLSGSDPGTIENLGGWLTTAVARVCLNMLASRREQPAGMHLPESAVSDAGVIDPEHDALLADSIGPALLVILHTLAPAERLAFVLHDIFAVPFEDIAAVVGRSPAAARQPASRARRRVQGAAAVPGTDLTRQRAITDAFLTAARPPRDQPRPDRDSHPPDRIDPGGHPGAGCWPVVAVQDTGRPRICRRSRRSVIV